MSGNIFLIYKNIKKIIPIPNDYKELCSFFLKEYNENENKNFIFYYNDVEDVELLIPDDNMLVFEDILPDIKDNTIIVEEYRLFDDKHSDDSKSFIQKSSNDFIEKKEVTNIIHKKQEIYKVFFITSNQSSLDDRIKYELNQNGMVNLQKICSSISYYKGENFTTSVFSFDIIKDDLSKKDFDKENKNYRAVIKLREKGTIFEGFIFFKETKNNFIFDFKFEDYKGYFGTTSAPNSLECPHSFQIKLYKEALKRLKILQGSPLSLNLTQDSLSLLIGKDFNIDLFLEIFKSCYSFYFIKTVLIHFNVKKAKLPTYFFEPKEYSGLLDMIGKNPKLITKYCTKEDDPKKYYKIYYTLLLYFRSNYEKDRVHELLLQNNLWIYFKEILPSKYHIFSNMQIPSELIDQMINQTPLSFKIIEGTIFYVKFLENLLIYINKNLDSIYKLCIKEKKVIKINGLIDQRKEDDLLKIVIEIEKLVNYELNKGKFVLFEKEIFNKYTGYYFKKDLKKLLLIKKAFLLCRKVDKELEFDYDGIIHQTALELIKKGELKNEELLDFIENDNIYFIENKKEYLNLIYRPLTIFDGFDLENVNDNFYEKWNKVNIFKKYSFVENYYSQNLIINKINHMKDFGKLLRLFNYENENLRDNNIILLNI